MKTPSLPAVLAGASRDAGGDHQSVAGVQAPGILRRLRCSPPVLVLALLVAAWIAVFGILVWQRHDRFGTFGFDLGIYDQATWLVAHFDGGLITVRGLGVFGHHASVGLALLAPAYWLGAGPQFLDLFQVVVVGLGAVPVFLLARERFGRPWPGVVLGAAFLLHPALQFLVWETFHPETVAITPLLAAYYCSVRQRWGWFATWSLLAIVWKEDVALAVMVLGLLVAWRGQRKIGLVTAGVALVWFLTVSQVLLPAVNGEQAFYERFFGDLGSSPIEIAGNSVTNPSLVTDRLSAPDAREYLWQLTAPFGLVPLLAPGVLLLGLPQLLVNLLSVNAFTRAITYHYAALPLSALTLALVESTAWLDRRLPRQWMRHGLLAFVAASAIAGTVAWGPSPLGVRYDEGWWPPAGDERRPAKEAALELVPEGASVSVTYQFVPHLTHRREIYEFPNPWRGHNWGVAGENLPDPATVEWIVADRRLLGPADQITFDEVLDSGDFETVFDEDGVVVLRRVS